MSRLQTCCSRRAALTTFVGVVTLSAVLHLLFYRQLVPRVFVVTEKSQVTSTSNSHQRSGETLIDAVFAAKRGSAGAGVRNEDGRVSVKSIASSGVKSDRGSSVKNDAFSGVKSDTGFSVKNDTGFGVKSDTGASVKNYAVSGVKVDTAFSVKNGSGSGVKENAGSGVKIDVRSGGKLEILPAKISVTQKELCPENPPINETKVPLNLTKITYEELKRAWSHVMQQGGHYAPSTCQSRERVAIIIPYRYRERNLHILLNNLIPFLIRQQAEFTVFLVEQTEDYLFNRCLMFNVGFVESSKHGNFSCYILHDTDLIPRDFRNLYRCDSRPRHLVLCRSNENWIEKLPYNSFIGGALAVRREHMEKSNGCSNSYFGWGLEDDDLEIRLKSHGFPVIRYAMEIGGYYSLGHAQQSTHDTARAKLVKTIRQRMNKEGLNTLNYTLVRQEKRDLYTRFLVRPPPPSTDLYT